MGKSRTINLKQFETLVKETMPERPTSEVRDHTQRLWEKRGLRRTGSMDFVSFLEWYEESTSVPGSRVSEVEDFHEQFVALKRKHEQLSLQYDV